LMGVHPNHLMCTFLSTDILKIYRKYFKNQKSEVRKLAAILPWHTLKKIDLLASSKVRQNL